MIRTKKVFALILALIMVCSLAPASVRAEEEDITETAVESEIEETVVEETEEDLVRTAPMELTSNRSSETYVLTAEEELHIPYIQGAVTVRASFVPETSGYYNFTYSEGSDMTFNRLSILNAEENVYTYYDVASMDYGYTALQDVYLTAGHTYYYEAQYTGTAIGSETEYMMLSVGVSTNTRSCGENVYWDLTEDGLLTISGAGPMWNQGSRSLWEYKNVNQVIIESGVTRIGSLAFYNCTSLTSVTVGDSVTEIGSLAFCNCTSLASITMGDSVTTIDNAAFANCSSLINVSFWDSLVTIGDSAFTGCESLPSVSFGESLTTIGNYAFYSCNSLPSVSFGESLTAIGNYAFYSCNSLSSLIIGDSLTTIGNNAFDNCISLTDVYYTGSPSDWAAISFSEGNAPLLQANVHFEKVLVAGEELHIPYIQGTETVRARFVPEESGYYNFTYSAGTNMTFTRLSVLNEGEGIYVNYDVNTMTYGYTALQDVYLTAGRTYYYETEYTGIASGSDTDYLMLSVSVSTNDRNCGADGADVHWDLTEDGVLTISGSGDMRSYYYNFEWWAQTVVQGEENPWTNKYVRNVVINTGVNSIGNAAFLGCDALVSVEIPESVNRIGEFAFSKCIALTSIEIPESVTTIEYGAFSECSALTSVVIPNSITELYGAVDLSVCCGTFYNCVSLTNVNIPNSVNRIGDDTFNNCVSLANITIPNSVSTIGFRAFYNCISLTNVTIPSTVTTIEYNSFEGCKSITTVLISSSNNTVRAFSKCNSLKYVYYCGTEQQWNSMEGNTEIAAQVFYIIDYGTCGIDNSTTWALYQGGTLYLFGTGELPSYSRSCPAPWHDYASDITTVVIENEITYIGNRSFDGFGTGVKYYYLGSFAPECDDTNVLNAGLNPATDFGVYVDGTWIIAGETLTVSGSGECPSFQNNAYKDGVLSVIISDSVTSISDRAFYGFTSLTSVSIPESVTSIGSGVFENCISLTGVDIPGSVTSIGQRAFYNCKNLETIAIPEGVTEIGSCTFFDCINLRTVTIPESVVSIGVNAFELCFGKDPLCSSLSDVYYNGTENRWNSISIASGNRILTGATIHFGKDSESGFCGDNLSWEMLDGNLSIYGSGQMWDFTPDTAPGWSPVQIVAISDGVTNVGNNAFALCASLISAALPATLSAIGSNAFAGCISLTTALLPANLTVLGNKAFQNCIGLQSVSLPAGLETIGDYAFQGCKNITEITLPDGLVSIGKGAFAGCSGLTTLTVPGTVTAISDLAFERCTGLDNVTIEAGVTTLGEEVFADCSGITEIHLPSSLTAIDAYCFDGCTSLAEVFYNGSQSSWESIEISEGNNALLQANIHFAAEYVLIEGEELRVPFVEGTGKIVKASFVPETNGYYNFTYSSGTASVSRLSVLNSEGTVVVNYLVDTMEYGYTALSDVYLTAGNTYYYEAEYSSAQAGSDTDYLMMEVSASTNDRSCGENAYWDLTEDGILTISGSGDMFYSDFSDFIIDETTDYSDYYLTYPWRYKRVREVRIESGITTISYFGFINMTELTDVSIGDTVDSIGYWAFGGCTSLENVSIPQSVSTIWSGAFIDCTSLDSVELADGITTIRASAFARCSALSNINLPGSLTKMGEYIFEDCTSLTDVVLPGSLSFIDVGTFYNCTSLSSITISASVTNIDEMAFSGCTALANVYYAGSEDEWDTINIGKGNNPLLQANIHFSSAYVLTAGEELRIPFIEGEEHIRASFVPETSGYYNFTYSSGTASVSRLSVLNSEGTVVVNYLVDTMEYGYTALSDVYLTAGNTYYYEAEYSSAQAGSDTDYLMMEVSASTNDRSCGENAYWDLTEDGILTISGTGDMFYSDFSSFTDPEIDYMNVYLTFPWHYKSVREVRIENGITRISWNCFKNMTEITDVSIGDTVVLIGGWVFEGCTSLESVSIPQSVSMICGGAFKDCTSLTSVELVDGITTIDSSAFSGCFALSSINLPGSLTDIGSYVFENCTSLSEVVLPGSLYGISEELFLNCSSLTDVVISEGPSSIQNSSFENCTSLNNITIPTSVTNVYPRAFYGCTSLANVYYAGTQDEWTTINIGNQNESLLQAELHCREDETPCIVMVTSSAAGVTGTIAPVYGGGTYYIGESVTVGASNVSGFTFLGWYADEALLSADLEYTFTAQGDMDLTAVYEAKTGAQYTLKVTGLDFKVNSVPQNITYYEKLDAGTEVTLDYYGNDTFLRWENTINQPHSTNPSVTLTMNRNYELRVDSVHSIAGDEETGYYAYVEFVSPYNQVMSASIWTSKDSPAKHELPGSVSRSGYRFLGWTIDGVTQVGVNDIIDAIDETTAYIQVKALMERVSTVRTVTVFDDRMASTEYEVILGNYVSLQAGTVSGKAFKCWALDEAGDYVLSYSPSYSLKVTTDIQVYAVYVEEGVSFEALPAVATTGVYAFEDGSKTKISFMEHHDVPEGYTVVSYGIIFGTDPIEFPDAETAKQKLVYGSTNASVRQAESEKTLKRDNYEVVINMSDPAKVAYARGYLVVINEDSGLQDVLYGQLLFGSYNSLSANEG